MFQAISMYLQFSTFFILQHINPLLFKREKVAQSFRDAIQHKFKYKDMVYNLASHNDHRVDAFKASVCEKAKQRKHDSSKSIAFGQVSTENAVNQRGEQPSAQALIHKSFNSKARLENLENDTDDESLGHQKLPPSTFAYMYENENFRQQDKQPNNNPTIARYQGLEKNRFNKEFYSDWKKPAFEIDHFPAILKEHIVRESSRSTEISATLTSTMNKQNLTDVFNVERYTLLEPNDVGFGRRPDEDHVLKSFPAIDHSLKSKFGTELDAGAIPDNQSSILMSSMKERRVDNIGKTNKEYISHSCTKFDDCNDSQSTFSTSNLNDEESDIVQAADSINEITTATAASSGISSVPVHKSTTEPSSNPQPDVGDDEETFNLLFDFAERSCSKN
jgi:hypothetical protein